MNPQISEVEFNKKQASTPERQLVEGDFKGRIIKLLKLHLPANLAESFISNPNLIARGKLNPVFQCAQMSSDGHNNGWVIEKIEVKITLIKIESFIPWEKLFKEHPSAKLPRPTPHEVHVITVTHMNSRQTKVQHFFEKRNFVEPSPRGLVAYYECMSMNKFFENHCEAIYVHKSEFQHLFKKMDEIVRSRMSPREYWETDVYDSSNYHLAFDIPKGSIAHM